MKNMHAIVILSLFLFFSASLDLMCAEGLESYQNIALISYSLVNETPYELKFEIEDAAGRVVHLKAIMKPFTTKYVYLPETEYKIKVEGQFPINKLFSLAAIKLNQRIVINDKMIKLSIKGEEAPVTIAKGEEVPPTEQEIESLRSSTMSQDSDYQNISMKNFFVFNNTVYTLTAAIVSEGGLLDPHPRQLNPNSKNLFAIMIAQKRPTLKVSGVINFSAEKIVKLDDAPIEIKILSAPSIDISFESESGSASASASAVASAPASVVCPAPKGSKFGRVAQKTREAASIGVNGGVRADAAQQKARGAERASRIFSSTTEVAEAARRIRESEAAAAAERARKKTAEARRGAERTPHRSVEAPVRPIRGSAAAKTAAAAIAAEARATWRIRRTTGHDPAAPPSSGKEAR